MLPFIPHIPKPQDTNQDIPKELDIFYRAADQFLPEGKTWEDLTDIEREEVRSKFRFDPYKPGMYQAITGVKGMI